MRQEASSTFHAAPSVPHKQPRLSFSWVLHGLDALTLGPAERRRHTISSSPLSSNARPVPASTAQAKQRRALCGILHTITVQHKVRRVFLWRSPRGTDCQRNTTTRIIKFCLVSEDLQGHFRHAHIIRRLGIGVSYENLS